MRKFCSVCEDYRETKIKTAQETFNVRGVDIEVCVSVEVCVSCGENLASDAEDQKILNSVNSEYRKRTNLLTPEEIKQIRSRYNLSQRCFALLLGMSEATINRYENGALQDRTHDTAIRACEEPRFVRDLLERRGNLLTDWQCARVLNALTDKDNSNPAFFVSWGISMPDEVSEHTGFRHFDYNRFAYVVIHLCNEMGQICTTIINKLLFYSDFLNYKTATVSLTGTAYRRLNYGPVPADYDGVLSKMESEGLVEREERVFPNGCTGYYFKSGPASDSIEVELTKHEKKVLNFISREFNKSTAKDISERSHKEDAWLNTKDKELISYVEARTLSLNLPE